MGDSRSKHAAGQEGFGLLLTMTKRVSMGPEVDTAAARRAPSEEETLRRAASRARVPVQFEESERTDVAKGAVRKRRRRDAKPARTYLLRQANPHRVVRHELQMIEEQKMWVLDDVCGRRGTTLLAFRPPIGITMFSGSSCCCCCCAAAADEADAEDWG